MIALINLQQAKIHLRRTDTDADYDIAAKLQQASEIVMDYIKLDAPLATWTLDTSPVTYEIPALIQAAALLVTAELFVNREATTVNVLSPAVCSLLHRYRDPAMA